MTEIGDFFKDKNRTESERGASSLVIPNWSEVGEANRVDGITEADYERVGSKIEAVATAAWSTTVSHCWS